jgi:O-antigen/teichoic acid export membrane protein
MAENKYKTIILAYGLNIFAQLCDIVFFLLLVRLLVKLDVGLFNTVMALSGIAYVLLNGGLLETSFRGIAEGKIHISNTIYRGLPLRIVLLGLVAVVLVIGRSYWGINVSYYHFLPLSIIYLILLLWQGLYIGWLKASNKQNQANVILLTEALLKLSFLVVLVNQQYIGPIWVLLIYIAGKSAIIATSLLDVNFRNDLTSEYAGIEWAYHLYNGQGFFLLIAGLTMMQNRLDWLLLGHFLDQSTVATYAVTNKFYEIILFVLGIGANTIYPWLLKLQNDIDNEQNKINILFRIQFYIAFIAVPIAILLFPYVNTWIWHGRYSEVESMLRLLLPCVILAVTNIKLYYQVLAQHKERYIVRFTVAITLLQALFNYFMIPLYGIQAAIIGMWILNAMNIVVFVVIVNPLAWSIKQLLIGDFGRSLLLAVLLLLGGYWASNLVLAISTAVIVAAVIVFEFSFNSKSSVPN